MPKKLQIEDQTEIALHTICIGTLPFLAFTFYLVYKAAHDVNLTLDSEGFPIVTQFGTAMIYGFGWIYAFVVIFGSALLISYCHWYLKSARRRS